jgi:hypothetical protein
MFKPLLNPVDPYLLDDDGCVMISACDGSETLAEYFQSSDKFLSSVAGKGQRIPTDDTKINLHTLLRPSTFECAFRALPGQWESIVLTQHQIVKFCRRYRKRLEEADYNIVFLFQVRASFMVAMVDSYAEKVVSIYPLEYESRWNKESDICLVTPIR